MSIVHDEGKDKKDNTTNAGEIGIVGKKAVDFFDITGSSVEESATDKITLTIVVPSTKLSLTDKGTVNEDRVYLPGPHNESTSGQYNATLYTYSRVIGRIAETDIACVKTWVLSMTGKSGKPVAEGDCVCDTV